MFWAFSLSFKPGQNLHFWRFLCSQRGEKNAPTVLLRHIQFWTLSFGICNLSSEFQHCIGADGEELHKWSEIWFTGVAR